MSDHCNEKCAWGRERERVHFEKENGCDKHTFGSVCVCGWVGGWVGGWVWVWVCLSLNECSIMEIFSKGLSYRYGYFVVLIINLPR